MQKCGAVIAAAGESTRMGTGDSKQFIGIGNVPVLLLSLRAFEKASAVDAIVVVCREQDAPRIRAFSGEIKKLIKIVSGGKTRQESVSAGLRALPKDCTMVAVHDGARPFATPELIDRVVSDAEKNGASAPAVAVTDTLKEIGTDGMIRATADRGKLRAVQTPQVFLRSLYEAALLKAEKEEKNYTDDCQLLESSGIPVHLIEGDRKNIKLTSPEDLIAARAIFRERTGSKMRIGQGYDVHRLVPGRKLILGGTEILYEKGLLGHSDADVLTHALMDALCGAAGLGDIGKLFPDTDSQYEGADSLVLLKKVCLYVRQKGFEICNLDATVIAQRPKLSPYIGQMLSRISEACGIEECKVSVKATTEEGLGFTGTGEGIAAQAVCLIE